jgi:hypothetical protein
MRLQKPAPLLYRCGLQQIVTVKLDNVRSPGSLKAGIAGRTETPVAPMVYDPDTRVAGPIAFEDCQRVWLRRTVVDDQPLPLL